jgi:hypothetical protein
MLRQQRMGSSNLRTIALLSFKRLAEAREEADLDARIDALVDTRETFLLNRGA